MATRPNDGRPALGILNRMFLRKTVEQVQRETEKSELKRTLGAWNLVFLGIGCIIGAGIFVRTGSAASLHAGPAVLISFVIAGVVCGLAGLCYAELSLDLAGIRLGLHLQLHHARRVRGMDHGRAAAARIRAGGIGRRGRLGGVCRQPAGRFRHGHPGRADRAERPCRDAKHRHRYGTAAGERRTGPLPLQPARLPDLHGDGRLARRRRVGEREGQQCDRRGEADRHHRLHPDLRRLCHRAYRYAEIELEPVHPGERRRREVRVERHHPRRLDRVLRLYRVRSGFRPRDRRPRTRKRTCRSGCSARSLSAP